MTRRAIAQLAREGRADTRIEANDLHEQVADEYRWARQRLRSRLAAASWQRRLSSLRRLSMRASLVPVNDEPAATAIVRRVNHARQRLRLALRHAGKTTGRLHRLRLKVKRARYLMEDGGVKGPPAAAAELRGLRRLQDCLGDLHDEESLRESQRAAGCRAGEAYASSLSVRCNLLRLTRLLPLHSHPGPNRSRRRWGHRVLIGPVIGIGNECAVRVK